MSRNLTTTARRAVFAQQTDEVFIVLLTISHDSFDEDIRVASDPRELLPTAGVRGVVSRGKEYVFIPFDITLPQDDDSGVSKATLSVDNVGRELITAVRSADSAVRIKIEVVLDSAVDTVEVSLDDYRLDAIKYNAFTVSGDVSMDYYDLEPCPKQRFTPNDFPGVF